MTKNNKNFKLVNPVIEGSFQTDYKSNTPLGAAENMWLSLSKNIVNYVPKFLFSLEESGSLYHFEVNEKKHGKKYSIKQLDLDIDQKSFDNFTKNVQQYKNIVGGGHENRKRYEKDSSSSSSSSSDSSYSVSDSSSDNYPVIKRTSPIGVFHYTNSFYKMSPSSLTITNSFKTVNALPIVCPGICPGPVYTPVFRSAPFMALWP